MVDMLHTQTNDIMLKKATRSSDDDDIVLPVSGSRSTGYDIDGIVEMDEDARKVSKWKMASFGRRARRRHSSTTDFKVYKRRWIGLLQLVLLNIVVSWDVSLSRIYLFGGGVVEKTMSENMSNVWARNLPLEYCAWLVARHEVTRKILTADHFYSG